MSAITSNTARLNQYQINEEDPFDVDIRAIVSQNISAEADPETFTPTFTVTPWLPEIVEVTPHVILFSIEVAC